MFMKNIEDVILEELNNRMDIPIILDFQNSPEPDDDYGVFGLTLLNQLNRSVMSTTSQNSNLIELLKQDFRVLGTMTFYGNSCYDKAFEAQAIFRRAEVQSSLFLSHCISFIDSTSIRRVPELRDTKYRQRATFDVTLLIAYENREEIDWFNKVGYQANFPNHPDFNYEDYVPENPQE